MVNEVCPFEQNTLPSKVHIKLVKIALAVLEAKSCTEFLILYIYSRDK